VLIASTYPLEVVKADRWRQKQDNVKADALESAPGAGRRRDAQITPSRPSVAAPAITPSGLMRVLASTTVATAVSA
jgi:hypothetical protein